jgi:hypothetical protein
VRQAVISCEVGILLVPDFRAYLERLRFLGFKIEWHEGPGIISREFTVKGEEEILNAIKNHWSK